MLLDLAIPFHLRHPLEPLLIAAALAVPVLFAVLTTLAHVPGGRAGALVRLLAGGAMGGAVYLITMMLVTNWVRRPLVQVLTDPETVRYLALGIALSCLVTFSRRTGARVLWGVVLGATPAVGTLLASPPGTIDVGVAFNTFGVLVVTAAMMGTAMWIGCGPSHINRAGAALFATATFTTTLSAMPAILGAPGTVWRISTGIVTPWAITATCIITGFLGFAAVLEHRRLHRAERRERALLRSETRLGDLVRASFEGLVVHRDGVVQDTNERFAAMVGVAKRGPLGLFFDALDPFDDEMPDGEARQTRLKRADGTELPVEIMSQHMPDGRVVTAVRDVSERLRKEREIAHLARHDGLTGLLNRAAFHEAVDAELASGRAGAVVAVDLDRFKPINDTHGHGVGDEVLKVLSNRFAAAVRHDDILARIGGDEFALCLADLSDADLVERLCRRIVRAASAPIDLHRDGTPLRVELGASVGFALFPEHGTTFDGLLGHADLALYEAKGEGRGRVAAFSPEQREVARRRTRMSSDLRTAVREGAISVAYQSVVSVRSGEAAGLEAFARWTHPAHGEVAPSTFIPLAVENGSIHDLGRHVLAQACRTARRKRLRMAVNASATEMEADYAVTVRDVLAQTGLDPSLLEIEVTDAVLLPGREGALRTVAALRELGVGVVLDDFGAGHSALCALGLHPFSAIKLDGAFLAGLDAAQAPDVVRAVVQLARVQRLRVTAEGVETHRQLAMLTRAGLDEAQGYLFGRPGAVAPEEGVEAVVQAVAG